MCQIICQSHMALGVCLVVCGIDGILLCTIWNIYFISLFFVVIISFERVGV